MRILMTGGTGFIGSALVEKLVNRGDQITILTRKKQCISPFQAVDFCQDLANFENLNDFDAVINFAGEPIFCKAWTAQQKQVLEASRLKITRQLVALFQQSTTPPHTFLSGSASGFYGNLANVDSLYDESTPAGGQFTSMLCQKWESEALKATEITRVCLLRTGLVLSSNGGALKQMLPIFKLGLGGKLGSGQQHWAWITLSDYLNAVLFLLENAKCSGAYNLVAPNPVTNQTITQWLAKQYHRPACVNMPTWLLRGVFGERAEILLDNQPLAPKRLLEDGFIFQSAKLSDYSLF